MCPWFYALALMDWKKLARFPINKGKFIDMNEAPQWSDSTSNTAIGGGHGRISSPSWFSMIRYEI